MKIKNANIEYSNGSVVLKYPISPAELLVIKKGTLYNFQENFFSKRHRVLEVLSAMGIQAPEHVLNKVKEIYGEVGYYLIFYFLFF